MTGIRRQSAVKRVAAGLMLGALLVAFAAPPHVAAQPMGACSPVSLSAGANPCHHAAPPTCDRAPGCAGLTVALGPVVAAVPPAGAAWLHGPDQQLIPADRVRTGPPTPPPNR
jgi:hypothetical protein